MKLKKLNNTNIVLMISFIVFYIFRFVLLRLIGSKGVAYFSVPNELFFLTAFSVSYGLEQSIFRLVDYRFQRKSYDNTKCILKSGLITALAIWAVVFVLLQFAGKILTSYAFNLPLSYLGYEIMTFSILFVILTGVFRGYFSGTGNKNITTYSYFIFDIAYFVFGLLFSGLFTDYGNNIATLLRVDNYKYTYSAFGTFCGILLSSFVTLIYTLVAYFIFERRSIYEGGKEYVRQQDTIKNSIILIIKNAVVPFANLSLLFIASIFNLIAALNLTDAEDIYIFNLGEYYGKTHSMIMLLAIILCFISYGYIKRAVASIKKQQYHIARQVLGRTLHRIVAYSFFISAMIVVFGNSILSLFYDTNGQMVASYTAGEGILIALVLLALVFNIILCDLQFGNVSAIICGVSLIVHIIVNILLSVIGNLSIYGVIIGNIIFYALWTFCSFVLVSRYFQYTQEWFRTIVVTLISALVSALLGMVIFKSIIKMLTNSISLLISLLISFIIYIVILLLLRGFDEEELEETYIGKFMIVLGRLFNMM